MRRALAAAAVLVATALLTVSLPLRHHGSSRTLRVPSSSTGSYIVTLRDGESVAGYLADHGIPAADVSDFSGMFAGFAGVLNRAQLERMAADPRTAGIKEDSLISTDQTINPTGFNYQWGLDAIDQRTTSIDGSYTASNDASGVTVYILDTGVYAAHPDFGGRVSAGWSYRADSYYFNSTTGYSYSPANRLSNAALGLTAGAKWCTDGQSHPYDMSDLDQYDRTYSASADGTTDNNGHGTHAAGIIGSTTYGVAKGATIVPVQMLNSCGSGLTSMALRGINWILGRPGLSARSVVNMSIGFTETVGTIDCVINGRNTETNTTCTDYLLKHGVSVVAAAGNGDQNGIGVTSCGLTPAGTNGTISVGAVQLGGTTGLQEAAFSNYGECVDIFAPGVYLLSSWTATSGSATAIRSGTSMAAPHVTGAVAQILKDLTIPSDVTTVPGLVWSALKRNAVCDAVTYHDTSRSMQTPNRFLNVGSAAAAPCAPKNVTTTQAAGTSVVTWSELPSGNGNEITGYRVTTSPGSTGCSTLITDPDPLRCTLTGLSDGTVYTVSVRATTSTTIEGTAGTRTLVAGVDGIPSTTTTIAAPSTTTTLLPSVTPTASSPVTAVSTSKSIVLTWPAVVSSESVSYKVSVSPGGVTCSTNSTKCTFSGTKVGTTYTFSIVAVTMSGQTSGALRYKVTAGINQKIVKVRTKSSTSLTRIVTSLSRGTRTYRVTSGKCRIVKGRLVAPSIAGTCKFRVSIARAGAYRAMSAVLTVSVV